MMDQPALANGKLYLCNQKKMVCLDLSMKSFRPVTSEIFAKKFRRETLKTPRFAEKTAATLGDFGEVRWTTILSKMQISFCDEYDYDRTTIQSPDVFVVA